MALQIFAGEFSTVQAQQFERRKRLTDQQIAREIGADAVLRAPEDPSKCWAS